LGLAGGGTDLPSFFGKYGGAVFNATLGMYAYCSIIPANNGKIKFIAYDNSNTEDLDAAPRLDIDGEKLILHKGVYNRIVKDYNGGKPLSFVMSTSNDAPIGSGLGTSSTMVVAILEAFNRWLGLGLNDYQTASLAYDIERVDLALSGGMQDQYAAVFGGFNLMEFRIDGQVIVNRLRMDKNVLNELECSLLLYYGGHSRNSAEIIKQQIKNTREKNEKTIDAMQRLRQGAYMMKDAVLTSDFAGFAGLLREMWEQKKRTSDIITDGALEKTIGHALSNGAEAVKVSGAGGGGFLMLYCDPMNRQKLQSALEELNGKAFPVKFTKSGAESWSV
jgi:D-glycero-alpha-D-manno-heptose-7-phosphate kinase